MVADEVIARADMLKQAAEKAAAAKQPASVA